jgi:hypothetical protein
MYNKNRKKSKLKKLKKIRKKLQNIYAELIIRIGKTFPIKDRLKITYIPQILIRF